MPPEVMENDVRSDIVAAFGSSKETAPAADKSIDSAPAAPEPRSTFNEPAAAPVDKTAAPAEKATSIEPPARWTKDEKETFAALDPAVQKILLGRNKSIEADYTKKMMDIAQERQRFGSIEAILAPRRSSWTGAGLDDKGALTQLFGYWDHAQRDPIGFVRQFAQERGLDLASYFGPSPEQLASMHRNQSGTQGQPGQQGAPQAQPTVHPAVAAEIDRLRQSVYHQGTYLQQQAASQHQVVVNAAASELADFVNAQDDNGQSLHPFFEDVRGDMKILMESGRADTLKQAYDMATRLNENTFAKIRENDDIKRRRDDEARRAAEAERARKAASPVSSSASSGGSSLSSSGDEGDSVRSLLEKGFASARSSARI